MHFIDTHCHINMIVKETFNTNLSIENIQDAQDIIDEAEQHNVKTIINVGTNIIESKNCLSLAQRYESLYATVGIHPNDCTASWQDDFKQIKDWIHKKEQLKIVGIGECGIDRHYPDYNLQRQYDVFRAQIELSLQHDLALVVHSRDAYDETLKVLEEYKNDIKRAIMHCFSYDATFATTVIVWNFALGVGGTITYPKNESLRHAVREAQLDNIVLETDAPFLPPQKIRGKKNHPKEIVTIAEYLAHFFDVPLELVAEKTTRNAAQIFQIEI